MSLVKIEAPIPELRWLKYETTASGLSVRFLEAKDRLWRAEIAAPLSARRKSPGRGGKSSVHGACSSGSPGLPRLEKIPCAAHAGYEPLGWGRYGSSHSCLLFVVIL